jgi:hypothetical protein
VPDPPLSEISVPTVRPDLELLRLKSTILSIRSSNGKTRAWLAWGGTGNPVMHRETPGVDQLPEFCRVPFHEEGELEIRGQCQSPVAINAPQYSG